ncbi:transcription factor IIIA-like [Malaya genurostris]|uniref:transcription factor IIIA-like n=1 Tax=Malaya genurostris TaxID=325434 RepID=UPI0026F3E50D|nr:transcription factor IIIA-like [Malaya genurostris]
MVSEAESSDTDQCPWAASQPSETEEFLGFNEQETNRVPLPIDQKPVQSAVASSIFKCETCGVAFRKRDHFDRHRFGHTGVREYRCSVEGCTKEYTNRTHLNRHIRVNHTEKLPQPGDPICCKHPGCEKKFWTEHSMRRHYDSKHVLGKSWSCSECEERFWRKLQLKQHSFKHTGQYPHRCNICEKGFMNLKSFRNHRTYHALHKCESCTAEFTRWTDLVAHRKLQHATLYQCDICQGKFPSKKNLKAHIKIHLESHEVFQCPHDGCPKFYDYERNLVAHIRSKHEGSRKYVCPVPDCGRSLSTRQKLDQHRRMHEFAARSVPRMKVPTGGKPSTKRKDTGIPKRSSAARLANVKLEPRVEKILIEQSPDRRPPVQFECFVALDSASESEQETSGKVREIIQDQLAKVQEQIRLLKEQTQ